MKKMMLIFTMLLALYCISNASEDLKSKLKFGQVFVQEITIEPRKTGEIKIQSNDRIWVGFYIDFPKKAADKYKDQAAFMLKDKHSVVSVSGSNNGGTIFSPKNGVVEIIYENFTGERYQAIIWKRDH